MNACMYACMYACVPGGEVLSMRVELSRMFFVDEGSVYGWMDGWVVCGFLVVFFVPHTTWSRVGRLSLLRAVGAISACDGFVGLQRG